MQRFIKAINETVSTDFDEYQRDITKNAQLYLHITNDGNPLFYLLVTNPRTMENIHTPYSLNNTYHILVLTERQKDWLIRMSSQKFWFSNEPYQLLQSKYNKLIHDIYNNIFNKGEYTEIFLL